MGLTHTQLKTLFNININITFVKLPTSFNQFKKYYLTLVIINTYKIYTYYFVYKNITYETVFNI